jgi:hypothetical protein
VIKEMAVRWFIRVAVVAAFATMAVYVVRIRDRIDR